MKNEKTCPYCLPVGDEEWNNGMMDKFAALREKLESRKVKKLARMGDQWK